MADRVGQQLGNYRLTQLLGTGGFAEVYLGEHTRLTTKAAIKVLHAHLPAKESEHFLREAQVIAALKHPHIVRVLDFDVQNGLPFLIMDYYPAGTVRQHHPRGTTIPLETIAAYTRQIADALQYAHDQRLIHRDVKPENMLMGAQGGIALSDFGIATIAHSTSSMSSRQGPIGTIAYMAPEQIQAQARPASDQYALAIVVYEWLCGKRPFDGTYVEMIAKHLSTPPPSLSQQVGIAPAIEQVVFTALAKDPHQRYPTVRAFAAALSRAIQQAPHWSPSTISSADDIVVPSRATQPVDELQQQESAQPISSPELMRQTDPNATVLATPHSDAPTSHQSTTPTTPSPVRKTRLTRRSYGIIAAIVLVFLLTTLIPLGIQASNQYMQQIKTTAASHSAATAYALSGTATAASDRATASAQQTAAVVNGHTAATAFVVATATAAVRDKSPGYFAASGKMFYDEALDSADANWDKYSDSQGGSCQFVNNAYHLSENNAGRSYACVDLIQISGGPELVEVEMMIVKGDCGNVNIRYRAASGDTYPFRVCQNGSATIADHTNGKDTVLGSVGPGSIPLKAGWNIIGLEVNANTTITGYVNGQKVLTVQDDGADRIGNFALGTTSINAATEVAFRNLRAWIVDGGMTVR